MEHTAATLLAKLSRPASYSKHLPTLEIGAYDALAALSEDACFHASDSSLDDGDARSLGLAIVQVAPASLNSLYLGGNAIGAHGLWHLLGALRAAPALETLVLASNALGADAMSAFTQLTAAGAGCRALRHLALQQNHIGDGGSATLAGAMSAGALPRLQWLYAGENAIGDAGVVALAGALESGACAGLRRLGLQANSFGDPGLSALGAALAAGAMPEGELLYVLGNPFTSGGREALTQVIAETELQVHFGWPPPRTKSFLITPPDRFAQDEAQPTRTLAA